MLRLRRASDDLRIEIMPLIDVIFLLLTFFIYALVLMVRAELLPMELETYAAAEPATPAAAVTISIALDGTIYLNRTTVELEEVLPQVLDFADSQPDGKIYLALEAGEGSIDRAPILTAVWDRLKDAGLQINFVGDPKP